MHGTDVAVPAVARRPAEEEDDRRPLFVRCKALTGWLVVGAHGDAVAAVIEQAMTLTSSVARKIADMSDDDEARLTRAVWDRWLRPRKHSTGSAVGVGLLSLHHAVEETARRIDPGLFGWDERDGHDVLTDPAWQHAGRAAGAAALAFGVPELLEPGERELLASRWVRAVGDPSLTQSGLTHTDSAEPKRHCLNN